MLGENEFLERMLSNSRNTGKAEDLAWKLMDEKWFAATRVTDKLLSQNQRTRLCCCWLHVACYSTTYADISLITTPRSGVVLLPLPAPPSILEVLWIIGSRLERVCNWEPGKRPRRGGLLFPSCWWKDYLSASLIAWWRRLDAGKQTQTKLKQSTRQLSAMETYPLVAV